MLSPANIRANLLVKLGELTGKTHALPLVLFSPTARCNSRCVSCDWWRADGAGDLSLARSRRWPPISNAPARASSCSPAASRWCARRHGGRGSVSRARDDAAAADQRARARPLRRRVAARFQTVTVSLDGHTPELYRAIRGVDGLGAVADGVRKLRARAPHVGILGARHDPSPQLPLPARPRRQVARDRAGPDLVPGGRRRWQLGRVQPPAGPAAGADGEGHRRRCC